MHTATSGSALWLGGLLPKVGPGSWGNAREFAPQCRCQWDPLEVTEHKRAVAQCVSSAVNNAQMALLDELHRLSATLQTIHTLTEGQTTLEPTHKTYDIFVLVSVMVLHLTGKTNKTIIIKFN